MALLDITINNFAVVKSTDVDFSRGFTVVSGETGAGKSIVLDALDLVLGARAEASLIRFGEDQSDISASFSVKNLPLVQAWLKERDLDGRESYDELLIRRVLRTERPTRCYINDQVTTLATLKELGLLLVDIHGQHEHQSLLRKPTLRSIVDERANIVQELADVAVVAKSIQETERKLDSLTQNLDDNRERLDLLSFQLDELLDVQLVENEFAELEQEYAVLSNADELRGSIETALEALFDKEEGNVSALLGSQQVQLERLKSLDPNLDSACELISSALAQVDEAQTELDRALGHIDGDPERLFEVEARRDTLINLARKHRCNENDLLGKQHALQAEFDLLQAADAQPDELASALKKLKADYSNVANKISAARKEAAARLEKAITEQMQELGMEGGRLHVSVTSHDKENLKVTPYGQDDIDFMVSTNAGMPLKPLSKTASGGELSRISLAIQVIVSQSSSTPTLIFDEVDVGVGGRIAEIVGERLRELGRNAQVICITHLPQVAALGEQHILVKKSADADQTSTQLIKLDQSERIEELSRMLGGVEITESTVAHAREMLLRATQTAGSTA